MKNNNIEKDIYNSPTVKESIKVASETMQEEKRLSDYMDKLYEEGLEKFKKENPGKDEEDYIKEIRLGLRSGGKVIDFAKYKKDNDWHKATRKLDLASLFPEGKTLNSLTDKEKAAVNKLLKLTLGAKD